MKKIIYIVPSVDIFSRGRCGAVSHAVGIVNGFSESGYSVDFYAEPNVSLFTEDINKAVHTYGIKPKNFFVARDLLYSLQLFLTASRSIRSKKDSILLLIRKNTHCLWLFPFLRFIFNSNVRVVVEVNGLSYESFESSRVSWLISKLALVANQIFLSTVNKIYCVSEPLKFMLQRGLFGIKGDKIVVIPNGGPTPSDILSWHKETTEDVDGINFVFFGKLQHYNEYDVVFSAFESHVQIYDKSSLTIIGDGKMRAFIEARCKDIRNCNYFSTMSLKDALSARLINENTFGLIPLREGLVSQYLSPIKLYDYFSVGCPVIYSSVEGLDRSVNSAGVGIQYASGDASDLAQVFNNCVLNREQMETMRNQISQLYEKHTWKYRMNELLDSL